MDESAFWRAPAFFERKELLQTSLAKAPAGIALEFGVREGESLGWIAESGRKTYGFDSFEGLPEEWRLSEGRVCPPGWFAARPSIVPSNVHLIEGWFVDTLPRFLRDNAEQIGFVHVDCDLYSSTKTVLDGLGPRLEPGAIIVFDELIDFGNTGYEFWRDHEWRALCESGLRVEPIGRTNHQQAAVVVL